MAKSLRPDVCSRCGGSRIVRILWGYYTLTVQDSQAIESGQAILGLNRRYFRKDDQEAVPGATVHFFDRSRLPEWACLDCSPKWKDLHRLAARELEQEEAKQVACDAGDFEKAAVILHAQKHIELDHSQEIWALLSVLAGDALTAETINLTNLPSDGSNSEGSRTA